MALIVVCLVLKSTGERDYRPSSLAARCPLVESKGSQSGEPKTCSPHSWSHNPDTNELLPSGPLLAHSNSAGCQSGISPRIFSADSSFPTQGQEGQKGQRPRPLGSTSFLFSLHPAFLGLAGCRRLRKWSGVGRKAGSLGPQKSWHPDCNNEDSRSTRKREGLRRELRESKRFREPANKPQR